MKHKNTIIYLTEEKVNIKKINSEERKRKNQSDRFLNS